MAEPLYDVATVETPEQIELSLPLAGVGSRSIAYLLDIGCQIVPLGLALLAAFLLVPLPRGAKLFGKDAEGLPELGTLALALVSLAFFVVNFGYFALFEIFWNGQSPGKRWVGLRVLKDGGFPIDGRAALLRNLLRAVDFLPAFYVAGIAVVFTSGRGKRLGDYAAGTLVVREGRERIAPATPSASPLPAAELALVRGFLARRRGLDDEARRRLAGRIAARVAERLGRTPPDDAEGWLEGLV